MVSTERLNVNSAVGWTLMTELGCSLTLLTRAKPLQDVTEILSYAKSEGRQ
jgi:hypothetical protein